jgi:integrase/recombinase XerD
VTNATAVQEHVAWLAGAGYAPDILRNRRAYLRTFVAWADSKGLRQPSDVTPSELECYRAAAATRRHGLPPPLAVGSQIQALLAVKRFCAWCALAGVMGTDSAASFALPRRLPQLPRAVLSAREAEAVLARPNVATPCGIRDRAMLETLYSTGIRRGELIGINCQDVDAERGTLWIRRGKGGRQRVVPVGRRSLLWIERYRTGARARFTPQPDGTLFLNRRGRPLGAEHVSDTVRGYVRAASLGKTGSCHLFRHTMATLMLENGADVRFIQAILGHAQLSTTALYTHVAIGALQAVHRRTHPAESMPCEAA